MQATNTLSIAKILIATSIILCFGAPFLLTRVTCFPDFTSGTAAVGDTIGGILSPLIGLLGAILVYLALKEQVAASSSVNQQILEQKESAQLNKYLDYLIKSIENFRHFVVEPAAEHPSGVDTKVDLYAGEAIYQFLTDVYCDLHSIEDGGNLRAKLMELSSILEICDKLLRLIHASNVSDKSTILNLTEHQFRYRIFPKLETIGTDFTCKHFCHNCQTDHGLPEKFCVHIKSICKILNISIPTSIPND
jgi:hypothetical protein